MTATQRALNALDQAAALLRPLTAIPDGRLTVDQSRAVVEAWHLIHGGSGDEPYSQRRRPLADLLPDVTVWCVVQTRNEERIVPDHRSKVWPGMAFYTRERAEAWREFLEDYYYDTHVRDGAVTWTVALTTARPSDLYRHDDDEPVGSGYYPDRHPWVGTLPMRRFRWDREACVWVRQDVAVRS